VSLSRSGSLHRGATSAGDCRRGVRCRADAQEKPIRAGADRPVVDCAAGGRSDRFPSGLAGRQRPLHRFAVITANRNRSLAQVRDVAPDIRARCRGSPHAPRYAGSRRNGITFRARTRPYGTIVANRCTSRRRVRTSARRKARRQPAKAGLSALSRDSSHIEPVGCTGIRSEPWPSKNFSFIEIAVGLSALRLSFSTTLVLATRTVQ
jgi:hypothetical protein